MSQQGIPRHILIENARRELALFTKQRDIAVESITELTDARAAIEGEDYATLENITQAVHALVQVRLLELQMANDNLNARIAELERGLQAADSNLAIPSVIIGR